MRRPAEVLQGGEEVLSWLSFVHSCGQKSEMSEDYLNLTLVPENTVYQGLMEYLKVRDAGRVVPEANRPD